MNTTEIRNSTKRVRYGVTKAKNIVPTGDCEAYRNRQRDDWYLRLVTEVKKYNDAGGLVVFVTLTYNDENLPKFHYYNEEGEKKYVKCFEKSHIDHYIKGIRKYFERKNISSTLPFKYMVCCEYGMEADKTHRPHYHCNLCFPPEFVRHLSDVGVWTSTGYQKFLKKYWKYGFSMYSKESKGGTFVRGDKNAMYVSKYCCKDVNFYNQPEVKEYLFEKIKLKSGKTIYKRRKDRYERIKYNLPKHWQSQGFGEDLLNVFDDDDRLLNGYNFNFVSDIEKGKVRMSKAPRYIVRKLLYEVRPDKTYKLNKRGEIFFSKKFDITLQKQTEFYRKFLNNSLGIDWNQYITEEMLKSYDCKDISLNRWKSARSLITGILESRSIEEFVLYKNIWSGVPVGYCFTNLYGDLDSLSLLDFIEVSRKAYLLQHSADDSDSVYFEDGYYNNPSNCHFSDIDQNLCVKKIYRFRGFDKLVRIIDDIMNERTKAINEKFLQDRENLKTVKLQIS